MPESLVFLACMPKSYRTYLRDGPNTTTTIIFQKTFCIWCHTKTAFDDTSDEKSLWFLCVPLCRRGIWCVIRGYPKNEKWGPARWTQKWSWSWLGRRLLPAPKNKFQLRPPCVLVRERTQEWSGTENYIPGSSWSLYGLAEPLYSSFVTGLIPHDLGC